MNKYIKIPVAKHTIVDNMLRRQCDIEFYDNEELFQTKALWFEIENVTKLPSADDVEPFLIASLLDAMQEGRDIVIDGKVSKRLLQNLIEFRNVFCMWFPQTYIKIKIIANNTLTIKANDNDEAICAYSGGVDATFSVWMHTQKKHEQRSQDIKYCCLVQGFDIPLADSESFGKVLDSNKSTLQSIDLAMLTVRTNYRDFSIVNWEHACGTALVSALNNFKHIANTGLIGSTEPYNALIPWGSSPVTDHLLSSEGFTIMHDGASYDRADKVKEISDWPFGCSRLRVCWAGETMDTNCGKCEKCMRTMLNFLSVNKPIPSSFPLAHLKFTNIVKIKLKSDAALSEWRLIINKAKESNIKARWRYAAMITYYRANLPFIILPQESLRRMLVKYAYLKCSKLCHMLSKKL